MRSGRSSIDSTEGSVLTNNGDLDDDDDDDDDETRTLQPIRFNRDGADSFDTDDDEDSDRSSDCSGLAHPPLLITCLKDSIVHSLASSLIRQFLVERQASLQQYARLVCNKNSIPLRPRLRPTSLPPRSLTRNRLSLPTPSSVASALASSQRPVMSTASTYRSTPEPDIQLTGLLRVTPLRVMNSGSTVSFPSSPRRSQVPRPPSSSTERTATTLSGLERRNHPQQQQQPSISLIGVSVSNLPLQLTSSNTSQSTQNPARQTPSTGRFRSASTLHSNPPNNTETVTRLPPINIERLTNNVQLVINRSNTTSTGIGESMSAATRMASGASSGANHSLAARMRTPANAGKLSRNSRPMVDASNSNNPSSTSPARSMATTTISASALRNTAASRAHHHRQKRSLLTSKAPPMVTSSGAIDLPVRHVYQMTN